MKKYFVLFVFTLVNLYSQKFEFLVPQNNSTVRPSQRIEINWLNQYVDSTLLSYYDYSTQEWKDLQFSTRKNYGLKIDSLFKDSVLFRIRTIAPLEIKIDTFLTSGNETEQSVITYQNNSLYVGTRIRIFRNSQDVKTEATYSIDPISENEVIYGSVNGSYHLNFNGNFERQLTELQQVRGCLFLDSHNILSGDKNGTILKTNILGFDVDTIKPPDTQPIYKIIKRNDKIYVSSYDGIIRIYNLQYQQVDSVVLPNRKNLSVIWAIEAIGDTIIFGGVDDTLKIFNNKTNQYIKKVVLSGDIRDIDLIDQNRFVVVGLFNTLKIFNISGELLCEFQIPIFGLSGTVTNEDYKVVGRTGKIITVKNFKNGCYYLEDFTKVYIIPPPEINRKIITDIEPYKDRKFYNLNGVEIGYKYLQRMQIYITDKKEIVILF